MNERTWRVGDRVGVSVDGCPRTGTVLGEYPSDPPDPRLVVVLLDPAPDGRPLAMHQYRIDHARALAPLEGGAPTPRACV